MNGFDFFRNFWSSLRLIGQQMYRQTKKLQKMTSPFYTSMQMQSLEPSFFELIMADRLNRSLFPAFRHIVQKVSARLASSNNRVSTMLLEFISKYLDEIEAIILGCVQFKCLWHHGKAP